MAESIDPDALRATADILEQIEELGFTPTLVHIEADPGYPHHIVNIDAATDQEELDHPQALQRVLDPISSDHASEVLVAAPEAPMFPEEHGPRYWDLEAVVSTRQPTGEKPA